MPSALNAARATERRMTLQLDNLNTVNIPQPVPCRRGMR